MPWPIDNPPLKQHVPFPRTIKEVVPTVTPLNVQIALAGLANAILERERLIKAYEKPNPVPLKEEPIADLVTDDAANDADLNDDMGVDLDDERRRP